MNYSWASIFRKFNVGKDQGSNLADRLLLHYQQSSVRWWIFLAIVSFQPKKATTACLLLTGSPRLCLSNQWLPEIWPLTCLLVHLPLFCFSMVLCRIQGEFYCKLACSTLFQTRDLRFCLLWWIAYSEKIGAWKSSLSSVATASSVLSRDCSIFLTLLFTALGSPSDVGMWGYRGVLVLIKIEFAVFCFSFCLFNSD